MEKHKFLVITFDSAIWPSKAVKLEKDEAEYAAAFFFQQHNHSASEPQHPIFWVRRITDFTS